MSIIDKLKKVIVYERVGKKTITIKTTLPKYSDTIQIRMKPRNPETELRMNVEVG